MRVLLVGAGGHGQVVADIFQARLRHGDTSIQPIGYIDDDPALHLRSILDLPVLGPVAQISNIDHEAVVVAIGDNPTRNKISRRLAAMDERFVTAIHPAAVIGTAVEIGVGTMICAGTVVNTGCQIGRCIILNTGCTVDHHTRLEDYAHVAPGTLLGGHTDIGRGALVGIGAVVMPGCSIGDWTTVGAGSVVTRDLPANTTAVGIPASVIGMDNPT